MTAKERLDAARLALRRAAGSQLARKEADEAEVARLEAALASWRAEAERVREAGESGRDDEIADAMAAVEAELATARAAAEASASAFRATLDELRASDSWQGELERAELRWAIHAAEGGDPFAPTAEARALENVRGGLAALEAEIEAGAAASPRAARAERAAEAEARAARAREELTRLKAERRARRADQAPDASGTDPEAEGGEGAPGSVPRPKSKRTL